MEAVTEAVQGIPPHSPKKGSISGVMDESEELVLRLGSSVGEGVDEDNDVGEEPGLEVGEEDWKNVELPTPRRISISLAISSCSCLRRRTERLRPPAEREDGGASRKCMPDAGSAEGE